MELAEFESAILLSLFSDRRVEDRGGYWADEFNHHRLGSSLWSLSRSTLDAYTLNQAESAAFEALEWLLQDRLAEKISVKVAPKKPECVLMTVEIDTKRFAYGYL